MKYMIEDSNIFLVDTNVLVYAFSHEQDSKNEKARELLDKCWDGHIRLAVSNQNFAEFAFVSMNKAKLEGREITVAIGQIVYFNGFKKVNYSPQTVLLAIEIANEFRTSFWDALLAATMKEHHITHIYTENTKDFKMPWIKAVNPFK